MGVVNGLAVWLLFNFDQDRGHVHDGGRAPFGAAYEAALKDVGLTLPHVPDWADPARHLYVVRSPVPCAAGAAD